MAWHQAGTVWIHGGRGGGGPRHPAVRASLNSWPDNAVIDKAPNPSWRPSTAYFATGRHHRNRPSAPPLGPSSRPLVSTGSRPSPVTKSNGAAIRRAHRGIQIYRCSGGHNAPSPSTANPRGVSPTASWRWHACNGHRTGEVSRARRWARAGRRSTGGSVTTSSPWLNEILRMQTQYTLTSPPSTSGPLLTRRRPRNGAGTSSFAGRWGAGAHHWRGRRFIRDDRDRLGQHGPRDGALRLLAASGNTIRILAPHAEHATRGWPRGSAATPGASVSGGSADEPLDGGQVRSCWPVSVRTTRRWRSPSGGPARVRARRHRYREPGRTCQTRRSGHAPEFVNGPRRWPGTTPEARVVKAFDTTFAGTLVDGQVAGQQLNVLLRRRRRRREGLGGRPGRGWQACGPSTPARSRRARQLEQTGFLHIDTAEHARRPGLAAPL